MAREVPPWQGKRDDDPVPPRVRLRVFQKFGGICPVCTRQLQAGKWDCDHIIALANGGSHCEGNLRPVCRVPCHRDKTKTDVALKAAFHRAQKKNAGIRKPRTITRWRKMNGEVVIATRER